MLVNTADEGIQKIVAGRCPADLPICLLVVVPTIKCEDRTQRIAEDWTYVLVPD